MRQEQRIESGVPAVDARAKDVSVHVFSLVVSEVVNKSKGVIQVFYNPSFLQTHQVYLKAFIWEAPSS